MSTQNTTLSTGLFEVLASIVKPPSNKTMPLAAIWLNKPIWTAKTVTRRIEEGDLVVIQNKELKDCIDQKPTHRITGCYGKWDNSDLHINVIDLKTQELTRIDI